MQARPVSGSTCGLSVLRPLTMAMCDVLSLVAGETRGYRQVAEAPKAKARGIWTALELICPGWLPTWPRGLLGLPGGACEK